MTTRVSTAKKVSLPLNGKRDADPIANGPGLHPMHGAWEASKQKRMHWAKAKAAVQDAYDRAVQIRRARDFFETCGDPRDN